MRNNLFIFKEKMSFRVNSQKVHQVEESIRQIAGQLNQAQLIHYGKELSNRKEKVIVLIQEIWNTIRYSRQEAISRKENYFADKTLLLLKDLNSKVLKQIKETIKWSKDESTYFKARIDPKEILLDRNGQLVEEISCLHRFYQIVEELKNLSANHWLSSLINETEGLEVNLQNINPFSNLSQGTDKAKIIKQLDDIWQNKTTLAFSNLLSFILQQTQTKLLDINPQQIKDFETCLDIYLNLPLELEKCEETAKKLFLLTKHITQSAELTDNAKENLQRLLQEETLIKKSLIRVLTLEQASQPSVISDLNEICNLLEEYPSLSNHAILSSCHTIDEIKQKLNQIKSEERLEQLDQHFGPIFATFFQQPEAQPIFKGLLKIKRAFEQSKEKNLFGNLLKISFSNKNLSNFAAFQTAYTQLKNHQPNFLIHREKDCVMPFLLIDETISHYLQLGVPLDKVNQLKQNLINHSKNKNDLITPLEEFKGNCEQQQLETDFSLWQKYYGPNLALHLKRFYKSQQLALPSAIKTALLSINRSVEQLGAFNLSTELKLILDSHVSQVPFSEEMVTQLQQVKLTLESIKPHLSKIFSLKNRFEALFCTEIYQEELKKIRFDSIPQLPAKLAYLEQLADLVQPLQAEPSFFMIPLMRYLLNQEGKIKMQDEDFSKKIFPEFIQNLSELKQQVLERNMPANLFNKTLEDFFTSKDWLTCDEHALKKLSIELEKRWTESKLNQLYPELRELVNTYLTQKEKDVLSGEKAFEESAFKKADLDEQVQLLLASLILTQERDKKEVLDQENSLKIYLLCRLNTPYLDPSRYGNDKKVIQQSQKMIKSSIDKLKSFCHKMDSKYHYPPSALSGGMLALLQEESSQADFVKVLENVTDKCGEFFNKDIEQKFLQACFKAYACDTARHICKQHNRDYTPDVQNFLEQLLNHFSIPSQAAGFACPESTLYVQCLIEFSVSLFINPSTSNAELIMRQILETADKRSSNLFLDLRKINKRKEGIQWPENTAQEIRNKIERQHNPFIKAGGLIGAIQANPFAFLEQFIPSFIGSLLPEQDKKLNIRKVRNALEPLKPYFNRLPIIQKTVEKFKLILVDILPPISQGNQTKLLDAITEFMETLTHINLEEELAKQKDGLIQRHENGRIEFRDRDERRQYLNSLSAKTWFKIGEEIQDIIIDTYTPLTENYKKLNQLENAQQQQLLQEIDRQKEEMSKNNLSAQILFELVPFIVKNKEAITKFIIQPLPNVISFINKLGLGFLGNKFLKMWLNSHLKNNSHLNEHTRKLILESVESMIKIGLLAIPQLAKNHRIEGYMHFIEYLNRAVNSQEKMDKNELFVEILKVLQQLVKELSIYGSVLQATTQNVREQYEITA